VKLKIGMLIFAGGLLLPVAKAADPNPKVEEIIAQIAARRGEKLTAEATAAQTRAKQMEERGTQPGMGGGGGNRGNRGKPTQPQGK
jgi:hypothetical protein